MSKKKRNFESRISDAQKELGGMNYPTLKRNCIIRGMPFEEAVDATVLKLQGWFIKNYMKPAVTDLLDQYDAWNEKALRARGLDDVFFHPSLRLGYIGTQDEDGNTLTTKKIRGLKKQKVKRDRTETGIFSGTKKAYTYQLQAEGKTKEETITLVKEKFPEAQDKSIGIWYNKAKKGK